MRKLHSREVSYSNATYRKLSSRKRFRAQRSGVLKEGMKAELWSFCCSNRSLLRTLKFIYVILRGTSRLEINGQNSGKSSRFMVSVISNIFWIKIEKLRVPSLVTHIV